MNLDVYSWTGTQTPSYAMATQMIYYGANNYANDVELEEIIAPGKMDDYKRINPICGKPMIKIRNNGSAALTNCRINYGIVGGTTCVYDWVGNLAPHSSTEVTLGELNWTGLNPSAPRFYAEVHSPNGATDEVLHNNKISTAFSLAPQVDSTFTIWVSTNNRASENAYYVYDSDGNTVFSRTSLANSTQYKDTITLPKGCYQFVMTDSDGDGLDWWANSDETAGFARFRKANLPTNIKVFVADFGKEIRYNFTVNQQGGNTDNVCNTTDITPLSELEKVDVYPNPAYDKIMIDISFEENENGTIEMYNLNGQLQLSKTNVNMNQKSHQLDISSLSGGFYFVVIKSNSHRVVKKIVIEK
jgi:hypothetical protein